MQGLGEPNAIGWTQSYQYLLPSERQTRLPPASSSRADRRRRSACTALAIAPGRSCSSAPLARLLAVITDHSPQALEALVTARLQDAYHDMASKELEKLMTLYAPDALIQCSGSAPIVGTAAI